MPAFASLGHRLFCTLLFGVSSLQLNAALRVVTDFESGSAQVLLLDAATQTVRISPAGDLQRGMPNWWFLRLDGVDTNQPVTLEVVARDVSVPAEGANEGTVRPLNPGWTLPACAAVSTNGTVWTQTSRGDRQGNRCVYRVPTTSRTLWLAWGPPFTGTEARKFIEQLARTNGFVKAFTLAKSRAGREVPALQISEGKLPPAQRPAVFVTARQHAWETGGTWVGIGLAEWLVSPDARAGWLRQNAEIVIVPVMDVDHVATGDGGKHARPRDHNRDWSDAPYWPEVAAAQKHLLTFVQEGRLAVYLDLHNPSQGATLQTFYVQYPPYVTEPMARLTERFLESARAEFGEIKLNDGKPSKPEDLPIWKRISAPWVCEHGNPQTIAFTSETPWNIPQGTPEGYRQVGSKLGRALEGYLRNRP